MPAPATNLNYIQSTTKDVIIPTMADLISKTNSQLGLFIKNAVFLSGGDYVVQPWLTSLPTSAVRPYSGNETFTPNFSQNNIGGVFDVKFYGGRVDVTGPDMLRNSGTEAALNLVRIAMQAFDLALRDTLGFDLVGDGTGIGGAYPGLALVGWEAAIDDGTTATTYGGASRTAYTVVKSYVNANGGINRALTVSLLDALFQNTAMNSDCMNLGVTTRGLVTKIGTFVQPMQRIMGSEVGNIGFNQVRYKNYTVISDDHVQTSPGEIFYGLNTRWLQMYIHKDRFFKWNPFVWIPGQDVMTSLVTVALMIINARPGSQGKIVDLDSTK